MNSATRSVAVVATQLPSTDRRALSQAWYSALHVSQTETAAAHRTIVDGTPVHCAAAAQRNVRQTQLRPMAAQSEQRGARSGERAGTGEVERRSPATDLSKRIERALVTRMANVAVRPAALAIKAADGRVQLLVRRDGATTRVIALCAPHLRANVDRALARARFALHAAGTQIEAV